MHIECNEIEAIQQLLKDFEHIGYICSRYPCKSERTKGIIADTVSLHVESECHVENMSIVKTLVDRYDNMYYIG